MSDHDHDDNSPTPDRGYDSFGQTQVDPPDDPASTADGADGLETTNDEDALRARKAMAKRREEDS